MARADPRNGDGGDGNGNSGHAVRLYGLLERDGIAPDSKRPLGEVLDMFRCHNADHVLGERLHGCEGPKTSR